jgi:uncharacterized protein (TIGR02453 family)
MISPDTFQFLQNLAQNNAKEWMDCNRSAYETAKRNFEEFVGQLLEGMQTFEPSFAELTPRACIFRLNRDIRFSSNKAPYKTNFGAAFSKGGKKSPAAGYYIHLEPGASFAAGGAWQPSPELLKGIRQEIDYDFKGFNDIVGQKEFRKLYPQLEGEQLKKAPQGYEADNPAIDFLRFKSFTVSHAVPDKDLLSKQSVQKILHSFATLKPFIDFLNRPLQG